MKWLTYLENIVTMLIIGICVYFDKSAWIVWLVIIPIMNVLYRNGNESS